MSDLASMTPEQKRRLLAELLEKKNKAFEGTQPLSSAQRHLWNIHHADPASPRLLMPGARRLRGTLDIRAMQAAFDELVRRHETLRTRFPLIEGTPRAIISAPHAVPLPVLDVSNLSCGEREAWLTKLVFEESRRPFDLQTGPVLRTLIIRFNEKDHALLRTVHRIVADGWSMGLLDYELATLYNAFATGEKNPLPELPAPYSAVVEDENRRLSSAKTVSDISFWKEKLKDAPRIIDRLADRPGGPGKAPRGHEGAHHHFPLSTDLVRAAEELAKSRGVTLFTLMLTAFERVLAKTSGESDLTIGFPVAHRDKKTTKPLIGLVADVLAVRAQLARGGSFLEALERVHAAMLEVHEHQDAPFGEVCGSLSNGEEHPFEVLFTLQLIPVPRALGLHGLEVEPLRPKRAVAKFDLALWIWDRGGFLGDFEYNSELFDPSTIEKLSAEFVAELERATASSSSSDAAQVQEARL